MLPAFEANEVEGEVGGVKVAMLEDGEKLQSTGTPSTR